MDVLACYSSDDDAGDGDRSGSNGTSAVTAAVTAAAMSAWWTAACVDAGRLLLLLTVTAVSPAAVGGSSGSSAGGGSCSALLPLMWRLGGVMCPGLWKSEVVTLGWLLACVSSQEVRQAVLVVWCFGGFLLLPLLLLRGVVVVVEAL